MTNSFPVYNRQMQQTRKTAFPIDMPQYTVLGTTATINFQQVLMVVFFDRAYRY